MVSTAFFKNVGIDYYSSTPKYLQLSNSIIRAIRNGFLQKNDTLPSINELNFNIEISRDTAEKAYRHLKTLGILGSIPGKVYYIKSIHTLPKHKIFLLFNKLSTHKKIIYDAIVKGLNNEAAIDFYIYNNDFQLFKELIENANDHYSHYVIISHFFEGGENSHEVINKLPTEKLIVLDKLIKGVEGEYGAVYENFEHDIFKALEQALPRLMKYHTLNIIFPELSYYPVEILNGLYRFCTEYKFKAAVIHDISSSPLNAGEVYISLMEDDIVILIERLLLTRLKIGEDIGVISYNETPLKKIILNGLTTLSTDFQKMGEITSEMILNARRRHVEIPFYLTLRASL